MPARAALGAPRTVEASGAEDREAAAAHRSTGAAWRRGVRPAGRQAVTGASADPAAQASFLSVLGAGGAGVASGAVDVSVLMAFLMPLLSLTQPVSDLVRATTTRFRVGAAAVARLRETGALGTEAAQGSVRTRDAGGPPAAVSFEKITFRCRPDLPDVHREAGFTAPAGRTRGAPLAEPRARIGRIEQDAPVLSGTLRENLLCAAPDATEEEPAEVLVRARLENLRPRPAAGAGHGGRAPGGVAVRR